MIKTADFRPLLRRRPRNSYKGANGHLLLIGGAPNRLGAILLAARAALRTGAGLVTVGLPECAYKKIPKGLLEVMYEPIGPKGLPQVLGFMKGKTAAAVGPGLGLHPTVRRAVHALIGRTPLPLVLDADALNALAGKAELLKKAAGPVILTPHPGEFSRLTGLSSKRIEADRTGTARNFAKEFGVIVVLKGHRTVVAMPDGEFLINPTGNPGMATAGMGDVLTGMIGSLLVQGLAQRNARSTEEIARMAALAGVYLHGLAGDRVAKRLGDRGLLASDVIEEIPHALQQLL